MADKRDSNTLNTIDENEENSECSSVEKLSKFDKYVYTVLLCYANLTYGISLTMTAPALVDYKRMLGVSTEIITHYYTLFSIGTILGALFGFLFKYINRQLTLIIILVLFALSTALSPQCPSFILFYLCGLIAGLGAGTLDTVQTVWLIEMWDEKSGSILQLSEGTYGLGCFIGPLIVEPFLAGEDESHSHESITTTMTPNHNNSIETNYREMLTIPYAISGSLQMLGALFLAVMYFYHKYIPLGKTEEEIEKEIEEVLRPIEKIYHRRYSVQILEEKPEGIPMHHMKPRFSIQVNNMKNFQNPPNPLSIKRRFSSFHDTKKSLFKPPKKLPRKTILGIGAIGFATALAAEMAYVDFSPTFYRYSADISGSKSAILLSAMTASYTLTRTISIFIAIKVKPKYMLCYHYFIVLCSCALLYFSHLSEIVIWIGNILFGIGIASFWSATFSHIEHYFEITDRVGTIYISALGLISIATQFIEGPLIEEHPIVVLYYCTIALIISLICFLLIRFIVWKTKSQTKSNNFYNENNVMKI